MGTSREVLRLSKLLASIPTVSYREHRVMEAIRRTLGVYGIPHASDRWGNLIARYRPRRARGRRVAFVAHTDHPGLIVDATSGKRAVARWLGGVAPRYFLGAKVRVETEAGRVRGRVVRIELNPAGRVGRVHLDMEGPIPTGAIGGWDIEDFRVARDRIRTRSADDLLGCASILALLKELSSCGSAVEVWGLFTRAEEVGLCGAAALAEDGMLPDGTVVLSVETSKQIPSGRLGHGVIVRVGDRMSVFDPEICRTLTDAAMEFAKQEKGFRWQRSLMDGGTCEASVFQACGYAVGAFALPLGNYHNMGAHMIAPEIVHRRDLLDLARFLPFAVEKVARTNGSSRAVRRKLLGGLGLARKEMSRSRSIVLAIAAAVGIALGGISPSHAAPPSSPDQPKITKPAMTFPSARPLAPGQTDPLDDYDALSYEIGIRISPPPLGDGTLSGTMEMRAQALSDLSSVDLLLGPSLSADSAWSGEIACAVDSVAPDRIRIELPAVAAAGDPLAVRVKYSGVPGPTCFPELNFYSSHGQQGDVFPVASTLSEPDCAHQWWPCKDRMDDKATVALTIDAPAGFVTAGNGALVREETVGDRSITEWRTVYPIAPYLVAFASSNYLKWTETYHTADGDSIPLYFYAYPEDADSARVHYEVMRESLQAFEPDSIFGPYPFRNRSIAVEKLGVVEFPWDGAMENQTIVFEGHKSVRFPHGSRSVLAHEISHQWFGDAVTCANIDHIWLNEGFASYSEALYTAWRDTPDYTRGYRRWMMALRNPIEAEYPGSCVRPVQTFNSTVYRKGAWVLHMLRGVLGRDTFFRCLHEYYGRFQYGNATTEDFTRLVEETTGRDLRWFFIPWLYGVGRPQIQWDWEETTTGGPGHRMQLHLRQTQPPIVYPTGTPIDNPPDAYSFPLEVRIYGDQDSLSRSVFVGEREIVATIDSLPFSPVRVALDPENWILADPRVSRSGGSLPYLGEIGPPTPILSVGQTRIWPNPSRGSFQILLRAGRGGRTDVAVYDVTGRRIRSFPPLTEPGVQEIAWVGDDDTGRRVASGIYWIRTSGPGGTRGTTAIVIR